MTNFDLCEVADFGNMKNISIFIVERNPVWGNLLKYRLACNKYTNTRLFLSPGEALRQIEGNIIPDYIIASDFRDANKFLSSVKATDHSIGVIFFTETGDSEKAEKLLVAGAADYIVRSGNSESGVKELIKNLKYLCREEYIFR